MSDYLNGNDTGVFLYDGLSEENIVEITHFPFDDASFDPVALIASISHIPEAMRNIEPAELPGIGGQEENG